MNYEASLHNDVTMKKDQFDGILALKLVAERKNFAAASELLGVSPSALSQMIKSLEKRVGIALLSRTTRSVSLTEAGERFLKDAGPAMDQILGAFEHVGVFANKPSGLLRLNMPQGFYSSFLAPVIHSFVKKYPEVSVEIFSESKAVDVVEGGFDAGIRSSEILAQDMVAIKLLGPVRYVIVASPKYWNCNGRPKHPKDLIKHNCLRIRLGGNTIYDRWEFENKGEEFEVQISGSLIFNERSALTHALLNGEGVAYANENLVRDEIKSGNLEVVLKQYSQSSAGFFLYFSKRTQVQPKLRVFIDHIKSEIK